MSMTCTPMLSAVMERVRRVFSTGLGELSATGTVGACCKLHDAGQPIHVQGGCLDGSVGTHPAIRALQEKGSHVCMSEEGQRVLDRRCVAIALGDNPPPGLAEGYRSPKFSKRYFSGFPVHPSVYGQGYCYLWLFPANSRSRAARILGAYPLIYDVLHLWMVLGEWHATFHLKITKVGSSSYHLDRVSSYIPILGVIATLCGVIESNIEARVGGGGDRVFRLRKTGYAGFFQSQTVMTDGIVADDRRDLIRAWFSYRGMDLPVACLDELWLITRASAHFSVNEPLVKGRLAMLAVLGDHVLKTLASLACVAALKSPQDCNSYMTQFSNFNLSAKFESSGLRQVCSVEGLSVGSKANADIFEAMVGVLSYYLSHDALLDFLGNVGIVLPPPLWKPVTESPNSAAGLNSRQMQLALQMAARGELG